MEDFSITTRLIKKEYLKAILITMYRQTPSIILTIAGVFFITNNSLAYFSIIGNRSEVSYFELTAGIFALFYPLSSVLWALNKAISLKLFKRDITYTFKEKGLIVEGTTFKSEFTWEHIIKQKEMSKFLLLYQAKKSAFFIDRTILTTEQIAFIKSKVKIS